MNFICNLIKTFFYLVLLVFLFSKYLFYHFIISVRVLNDKMLTHYSTVTTFAKFLGKSGLLPFFNDK